MAQEGGSERQTLGKFVRNKSGYGTTVSTAKKHSQHRSTKYIKHILSRDDTLVGLAAKYLVPVETIKRENRLWGNDVLFLREFILVPLTTENEDLVDPECIITTERERSGSNLSNGSHNSPDKEASLEPGPEARVKEEKSKEESSSVKGSSSLDFFNKYDSSLAKLKSDVARMEKNAEAAKSHVPGRSVTHCLGSPYELQVEKETEC